MDLNYEVFENRLTWRRFLILRANLPPESAYGYFLRDKQRRNMAEWTEDSVTAGFEQTTRASKK